MHGTHDIPGFCQRTAWAGANSIPFGLIGCMGWIPHARRLTNLVAAINGRPGRRCRFLLISFVPFNRGEHCVIRYRREGFCEDQEEIFAKALQRVRARCLASCQVCGRPALPVIAGGVFCHKHAPGRFCFEAVVDKRQIRRQRNGWCRAARATIASYSREHVQGACMFTYAIQGQHFLRSNDAPAGSRQQVFEYLVESGLVPENISGDWVFRLQRFRGRGSPWQSQ